MTTRPFPVHTLETAPIAARPALKRLADNVGMIPNLAGAMAQSPALIEAFTTLRASLERDGSLPPAERELVSLVNAVENGCAYCTAIHATFGLKAGLDAATIDDVRAHRAPAEPRRAALVDFARQLVVTRGRPGEGALAGFLAAGFSAAQALELVARLALSVMANYAGHLTQPEPDDAIRGQYRST